MPAPPEPAFEIRPGRPGDARSFLEMWRAVVAEGIWVRSDSVTQGVGFYRRRYFRRPWTSEDASIVAVSGFLYRKPSAGYSAFAAVNGAIEALVKVLAIELAPILINALVPGQVDTLRDIIGEPANRGRVEAAAATLPVGRIGTPDDLAHAALFLLENRFTTGAALDVDGGER